MKDAKGKPRPATGPSESLVDRLIVTYCGPENGSLNAARREFVREAGTGAVASLFRDPEARGILSAGSMADQGKPTQLLRLTEARCSLAMSDAQGLIWSALKHDIAGAAESSSMISDLLDGIAVHKLPNFSALSSIAESITMRDAFDLSFTAKAVAAKLTASNLSRAASQIVDQGRSSLFDAIDALTSTSAIFNAVNPSVYGVGVHSAQSVLGFDTSDLAAVYAHLGELEPESTACLADATERLMGKEGEPEGRARPIVRAVFGKLQHAIDQLAENPEDRFNIDDRFFEELVQELFIRSGYTDVQLTKQSRDGGRDIVITLNGMIGKVLTQVECKRYAAHRTVGEPIVQRLLGVVECYDGHKGVVITTATFSQPAKELGKKKARVLTLYDGEAFINWLRRER